MAELEIDLTQTTVAAHSKFPVTVRISGARPNAKVRLSLSQTQGTGSSKGEITVGVDSKGDGLAIFVDVVLVGAPAGREIATLIVTATDEVGDFFLPDARSVEVI